MLKPLLLSDTQTLLRNLCVAILVLTTSYHVSANDLTGDFSNNYQDSTVDSNNSSQTTNYNGAGSSPGSSPAMSAIAPTIMGGGGNDSCLIPLSRGIQLSIIGMAKGEMQQDAHCNRRKNARLLGLPQQVGGLGLQVSGISVMCQDPTVFRSMMLANTPCPINDSRTGKLLMGKNAVNKYRENPEVFVVGYELDKKFWNALLRVGEEYKDEEVVIEDTGPKLSISDRFRTTKQRNRDNGPSANDDRTGKD